jgi:uncharacterized protein
LIPHSEQFFFTGGGRRLFGAWQGTEQPPRAAALFCHPFGEEKKSSHRAFYETARAMAAESVASLRFDMTGCGDSEGEFDAATLALWREDIASAWDELKRRAGEAPLSLIGLRLGATLAADALELLNGVRALILWQPILEGKEEFDSELRRLLIQEMMTHGHSGAERRELMAAFERGERELELDGYPITLKLYREIGQLRMSALRGRFPQHAGILQFARRNARIEAFAAQTPSLEARVIDMPPIWARTDYISGAEDGRLLAREGVLPWLT